MGELTGRIFNIQHFSTEDGPGVRSTVFFQGCPLHCLWCANPESQPSVRQLAHRGALCVGCGACVRSCPAQALSAERGGIRIDRSRCTRCGSCTEACPSHAMFFYGETKTVDAVFAELWKDAGYYRDSGGGVTCSGGECMGQAEFVGALLRRCRGEHIHTALDTCGQFPPEKLPLVWDSTDLVLFDLKHMDSEKHSAFTGTGNRQILQNLEAFVAHGVRVRIRVPVIPGYNDDAANLTATAEYVRALDPGLPVDLLPYHRFGESKYAMLNLAYPLAGVKAPTAEQMARHCRIFTERGLDCKAH